MTEHEFVRAMLALAAADALDPTEQRRVDQHAWECDLCRKDLETWAAYAQSLRKLPQPAAPAGMVQRTQARILQERTPAENRRTSELMLGALAIFGWGSGWAFWTVARAIIGGSLLTWLLASTVLVWMTAGTAAVMLGRSGQMRRSL